MGEGEGKRLRFTPAAKISADRFRPWEFPHVHLLTEVRANSAAALNSQQACEMQTTSWNAARRKTETSPANKPKRPIPLLSPRVIATSSWLLQDDGEGENRDPGAMSLFCA